MESQALVIATIGVLGIGAQWVAWRTGWPAIVLMLLAGFIAGPVLGAFDMRLLETLTFDLVIFVKVISPQCHCKRPHGSRTFCSRV